MTLQRSMCARSIGFVLAIGAIVLTGCVSENPETPKPNLGPQPRDSQADVLLLNLAQPSDSDGDTAPDTIVASVHMFDQRYQLPVVVPGTLTFRLYGSDADEVLEEWTYTDDELRNQILMAQVGPTYRFRLQLPVDNPPLRVPFVTIQCEMTSKNGHVSRAWHRDLPWLSVPG